MDKSIFTLFAILLFAVISNAQVGINTTGANPDSSAMLDVSSVEKGFLPPRMTTIQRDAIPDPARGLMIYNLDLNNINFFNGVTWVEFGNSISQEDFVCGENYIDPRDSRSYKTVQIGSQCWMAENLNYGLKINSTQTQSDNENPEKYAYSDVAANNNTYGGMYQWDELLAYDSVSETQGLCPEGWHIPNMTEWDTLINILGGMDNAGSAMRSTATGAFHGLMGGEYKTSVGYTGMGDMTVFWSAASNGSLTPSLISISNSSDAVIVSNTDKLNAFYARCVKGIPNRLDEGVKVIDTLVYKIISDSAELAQGIYRYNVVGSKKSKDIIINDDVIIGTTAMGYLREVTDVSNKKNEMTLQTVPATMEDVFISGEFGFSTSDPVSSGKGSNRLVFHKEKLLYRHEGFSTAKSGNWLNANFNNLILYSDDNVTFSIPSGGVQFNPDFDFDFKFNQKKVKKFQISTGETSLTYGLDLELDAEVAYSKNLDKELWAYQHIYGFMAGPVPVIVVVNMSLIAEFDFDIDGSFYATTGYTNTNYLTAGLKYENDEWNRIWDFSKTKEIHPFVWNGEVGLEQNFALVPHVDVMLYSIAGPYLEFPLWEELNAHLEAPAMDYDIKLDVGLNATVGASAQILGVTLGDWSTDIAGFQHTIYETPDEVSVVSGNNQSAAVNNALFQPLKVKVTDNSGNSYIPSRVHFSIESGAGTLSVEDVWTDDNGIAETTWTLGGLLGTQTVKATVVKADGSVVAGSPVLFSATATEGGGGTGGSGGSGGGTGSGAPETVDMAVVKGGSYHMGCSQGTCSSDEQPLHVVIVSDIFMSKHEITCGQYIDFLNSIGCGFNGSHTDAIYGNVEYIDMDDLDCPIGHNGNAFYFSGSDYALNEDCPVIEITWYGANAYCVWAGGRLPTEAEWEFAAKGGIWSEGYLYGGGNNAADVAWIADNSSNQTHSVMVKDVATETGVYDMSGNVWEWCSDWYSSNYYTSSPMNNPTGPGTGSERVCRGGSFTSEAGDCTNTNRSSKNPSDSDHTQGFRLVLGPSSLNCPFLVTDYDGNSYNTLLIGNMCWMKENLEVTHYPNGTSIPHVTSGGDWDNLNSNNTDDAYCYYNNDLNTIYGALYTYAAAIADNWENDNTDGQGICPDGWHLPTDEEWKFLEGTVDTQYPVNDLVWNGTSWRGSDVGTHLKSIDGWQSSGNGDNNSCFTALPGGRRSYSGSFLSSGQYGYWWSATEYNSNNAWLRLLRYNCANVCRSYDTKSSGFSIRCTRDSN